MSDQLSDSAEDRAFHPQQAAGSAAPALTLDEEAKLVERAKSDPGAFGRLYEANYQAILNYVYRRTLSVGVAEELTSNTFFNALRGLGGFRPRPLTGFRSWLYQIATNEVRMHWRSRKSRRETLQVSDANELPRIAFVWPQTESPEVVREKHERYALVHQALGRLSEPYQTVLTLRYFEGLGHEAIAEILGKRLGTVKSLVHRGLAKLAKVMNRQCHPERSEGSPAAARDSSLRSE